MASGSQPTGLEAKSETSLLDPVLSSWMTREKESQHKAGDSSDDDEAKKREKESDCEIRELFRIFDKDHDNIISTAELGKMLRCMGMNVAEESLDGIMRELDKNCNGKIEYREFKAFVQEEMRRADHPQEQEKAIRLAFKVFDETGDGFIEESALRNAMKSLGEPMTDKELDDMMKVATRDEEGRVNYEEFITLWLASASKTGSPTS